MRHGRSDTHLIMLTYFTDFMLLYRSRNVDVFVCSRGINQLLIPNNEAVQKSDTIRSVSIYYNKIRTNK